MKKLTKFIFFYLLTFGVLTIYAQEPNILWSKTFGNTESDGGSCVQQTPDGGYIIAGYKTVQYGGGSNKDIIVIKTNWLGLEDWSRTFGSDSHNDEGCWVEIVNGGQYVVVTGYEYKDGGDSTWVAKLNLSTGATSWQRTYPQSSKGWCIKNTSDGGFIIVGDTPSSGLPILIKLYSNGTKEWHHTYNSNFTDDCYGKKEVVESANGGFAIVGKDHAYNGSISGFLLQTNSTGSFLRINRHQGQYGQYLYRYTSVSNTSDSGYIITGTHFGGSYYRLLVTKRDSLGELEWDRTLSTSGDWLGYSIAQLDDGNHIVAGACSGDLSLVKIEDTSGDTIWTKNIGGANYDVGNCVRQISDSNYIVVGTTESYGAGESDIFLVKIGFSTYPDYLLLQNDTVEIGDTNNYIARDSIIAAGSSATPFVIEGNDSAGGFCTMTTGIRVRLKPGFQAQTGSVFNAIIDTSLITLSSYKNLPIMSFPIDVKLKKETGENIPTIFSCAQNLPNPFGDNTTIKYGLPRKTHVKLTIFNLAGQVVRTLVDKNETPGFKQVSWNGKNSAGKQIPQGIYFYVFKAGDYTKHGKMVMIK